MEKGHGIIYVIVGVLAALIMYTVAVPNGWDWVRDVIYYQF